nr:hypothetical protein [Eubacterium sp.]
MNKKQYISRRTGKRVLVITECAILPDNAAAVCYQEMDESQSVYVLTKDMFEATFMSYDSEGALADMVKQEPVCEKSASEEQRMEEVQEEKTSLDRLLLFLDADTYREKMQILEEMKEALNDHLLNNMAVSLDLSIEDGMDGYALIMSELKIRSRYEGKRGERL